jgi:hypothetical protein
VSSDPSPLRLVLGVCLLLTLLGAPEVASSFKCMPIYGNWCGVDWPPPGSYAPPPVDAFDVACMRHDFCTSRPGSDTPCDVMFVGELRMLAQLYGNLPRPLQWAEYVIRLKAGGSWGGMPTPTPWDAFGLLRSLTTPCL